MRILWLLILNVLLLLNTLSCTEVECPIDSVVVMTCGIYDADSKEKYELRETLTITPFGKDTVLLNSATGIQDFVLPLRIIESCDTMLFHFIDDKGLNATDTLFISHENIPHFEAVECPTTYFHKLTNITFSNDCGLSSRVKIDSVDIVRDLVDYYDVENIQIYLCIAP